MIKEGQIITLDNKEEYAVLEKKELDNICYYILMSTKKPVKVEICTEDNNEITIIQDKEIVKKVLLELI